MQEKSNLQQRLQQEGWEFVGNVLTTIDRTLIDTGSKINPTTGTFEKQQPLILLEVRKRPRTDEEIRQEFLGKGHKQVLVTDAYDNEGNQLKYSKVSILRENKFLFMSFSSFFILLSTYVKPIFTFFQT
jgi:hypothetical protein